MDVVECVMAAKPVCKYGASCYRKNADHFKQFSHPGREEAEQGTEDGRGLGEGTSLPAGTRSKTPKGKAQPQRRMRPQTKVKNLACAFWQLTLFSPCLFLIMHSSTMAIPN